MVSFNQMYLTVMKEAYTDFDYEQGTEQQKASYRIFQFYQEMASGGFEGYVEWAIGLMPNIEPSKYINELVCNLVQIGAVEMAAVVQQYMPKMRKATHDMEASLIDEDTYIDILAPANAAYYNIEGTFSNEINAYIMEIYESIKNRSFFERHEVHVYREGTKQ